jgi:hypothetical protein
MRQTGGKSQAMARLRSTGKSLHCTECNEAASSIVNQQFRRTGATALKSFEALKILAIVHRIVWAGLGLKNKFPLNFVKGQCD